MMVVFVKTRLVVCFESQEKGVVDREKGSRGSKRNRPLVSPQSRQTQQGFEELIERHR
jgi:hypothetical protein